MALRLLCLMSQAALFIWRPSPTAYGEKSSMAFRTLQQRTGNRLLDCVPAQELAGLRQVWDVVSLSQSEEVCRQDGPLSHVYFPLSGIYATVVGLEDGRVVEASTVGNEGIIGIAAVLGLGFSPKTATTPVPGDCLRLTVTALRSALKPESALDRVLRRYAAYALRSAYQTVACNAVHSAEQRMCRWLLTSQDRVGNRQLKMTHEFLAQLLGVRRQTVTVIVGTLQAAGCIASQRGVVRILNRRGLEGCCCECYEVARSLYDQIVQCPDNQRN
jgi:CRP-like cAMP-binding protein